MYIVQYVLFPFGYTGIKKTRYISSSMLFQAWNTEELTLLLQPIIFSPIFLKFTGEMGPNGKYIFVLISEDLPPFRARSLLGPQLRYSSCSPSRQDRDQKLSLFILVQLMHKLYKDTR